MAKKKGDRLIIQLECAGCHTKNYATRKNKKNDKERLTLQKYCKHCKKKTDHKESK